MSSTHTPVPDVLLRNIPDLTSTTERIGAQAFAHGGYSDIWRGVERSGGTERDVVIKIIRFATRDEVNIDRIKMRISREVIAWRSLNHTNILPFYGLCWLFGYDRHNLPSLVLPYCEAGTCIDYLKGHPDANRASIVQQVADALNYLHTLDPPVIHGDIKAGNVLMQKDGTPMLADFGLSRVMMEGSTGLTTSSVKGSCRWMAPELFGDGEADTIIPVSKESDVWAFGCLCLEVLWDTVPWESIKTDPPIIRAVTSKRQPTLPKGVESTALGRIVQRCWAYKAEDRPNMTQLVLALLSGVEPSGSPTHGTLQFAINTAQGSPHIHPLGRGYQHYQSHLQPSGHIIPGIGAGMGREPEHHHLSEHSLAGLLGGNRKRPKYTRSKTGCLTCRLIKIKCDEPRLCTKCAHEQRESTWPKDTSSALSSHPGTAVGTPQRPRSRTGQSSDLSRSNSGRAVGNFLSGSECGSSGADAPSRETSPQERLDSLARNSTESRTPGLVVPHSGSSLSGHASNDHLTFPQPLDMTSFGRSGVDSFPLSAQFRNLSMGYNDQLSMMDQPLSVDSPTSYSPWGTSVYGSSNSIDTSTANGQWSATSNQLLGNPDPIAPFFRSVQERNLIRHYCNTSTMLTMAVPSQVNPILAVNLPLVLSTPPPLPGLSLLDPNAGGSPATEALRLSLLGVGAIHQAYLLARSVGTDAKVPQGDSADDLLSLATSYQLQATRSLALACQTIEGTRSDAALGASVTISLIDIFAGGYSWQSNMMLAKTLVSLRGGPGAIVAHNQPARKSNRSGVTISAIRLFLEILTVYEVCGSFTSNEPPQLLGPSNSDWWLSHESDLENYHTYSVENVFGMSRRMVELMARVSTLVIRPTQFLASISEVPVGSPLAPAAAMGEEAQRLYQEVENWTEPPLPEVLKRRVVNGNTAYRFAMQIMLLRDVFRVPRNDYRVQKAAHTIIECCFECTKYMGMGVALTWPVIIAGCQITSPERSWVAETFEGFRKHCCFEIDTAEQIVCEVWRREDEGLPKASWRSVIADLNLRCLLI